MIVRAPAVLAATMALAGAASAAPVYNPGGVAAAAMARIERACARVVRLPAGSAYDYAVCQESLSRSLAAAGPAAASAAPADDPAAWPTDRRARERRACALVGLDPASPTLGQCAADLDAELRAANRPIM